MAADSLVAADSHLVDSLVVADTHFVAGSHLVDIPPAAGNRLVVGHPWLVAAWLPRLIRILSLVRIP